MRLAHLMRLVRLARLMRFTYLLVGETQICSLRNSDLIAATDLIFVVVHKVKHRSSLFILLQKNYCTVRFYFLIFFTFSSIFSVFIFIFFYYFSVIFLFYLLFLCYYLFDDRMICYFNFFFIYFVRHL